MKSNLIIKIIMIMIIIIVIIMIIIITSCRAPPSGAQLVDDILPVWLVLAR